MSAPKKYFYDTEFHEDGQTIDLISIGIVAEDGREYYAVNADADWDRIAEHQWLMWNVVPQLPPREEWKTKDQIRAEVKAFLLHDGPPELWAWFAAYDHVVLAQLFGTMLDLPPGIPMYTNDLRSYVEWVQAGALPAQTEGVHNALEDARHLKAGFEYVMQCAARPRIVVGTAEITSEMLTELARERVFLIPEPALTAGANSSDGTLAVLEASGVGKADQFDALVAVQKFAATDELWNDGCLCGHTWDEHNFDVGCIAGWEFDGPDPGVASEEGCNCQLVHTEKSL